MEPALRIVLVGTSEPTLDLDGCRRGDRAALESVFRQHAEGLERLLVRLVGPRADAEDLLQDTFSAAIAAFPRFRGHASVKTWLHRIAVNVACNHLRSPRHRAEPISDDTVDDQHTPAELLERAQLIFRLYGYLDELGAKQRVAFLLHVVEGLPIAEVAAVMNASKTATKSRVFLARRALLRRLRRDGVIANGDRR